MSEQALSEQALSEQSLSEQSLSELTVSVPLVSQSGMNDSSNIGLIPTLESTSTSESML